MRGAWTQGVPNKPSTRPWQETLFHRLAGAYAALDARSATGDTERSLGWDHHVYFFVGRPHPGYGESIGVYRPPGTDAPGWAVAPFDTGGVVTGRTVTDPVMDVKARVDLVNRWVWTDMTYAAEQAAWIADAFDAHSGYVGDEVPRSHLVREIPVTGNTDFAWSWEGRLPGKDYERPPVELIGVYLSTGMIRQYFEWLRDGRVLPPEDQGDYFRTFGPLLHEAPSPVAAVRDILTRGG